MSAQRVAYYYDNDYGHFHYGPGHPMKPHRMKLTHHLLTTYGLYRKLHVFNPHRASIAEMTKFHSEDYVKFLSRVTPDSLKTHQQQMGKFTVGEYTDCPVFADMFEFCSMYTGASIDGAIRLNHGLADVCINWAGGLHHAKKSEASGFCYINDIVLSILELLKYHPRVLYIDIDIHHGDGVEEAFYCTDRVMTVSFHKFGDFFPGTGDIKDVGEDAGKYYSVNFPLKEGIDDISYEHIFKPVITRVMEMFKPTVVVLQCGADSLTGDRLGCFNLTVKGHAECVKFVQGFGLPTLVLGGGGYTVPNVARCWAYETATLLKTELADEIPHNHFHEYFEPSYKLHLTPAAMENMNSPEYLDKMKENIYEHLRQLDHAPSVQFHQVPPDWSMPSADPELHPDERADDLPGDRAHKLEYYEDDEDQDGEGGLEKVGGDADASRGRGKGKPRAGRAGAGGDGAGESASPKDETDGDAVGDDEAARDEGATDAEKAQHDKPAETSEAASADEPMPEAGGDADDAGNANAAAAETEGDSPTEPAGDASGAPADSGDAAME